MYSRPAGYCLVFSLYSSLFNLYSPIALCGVDVFILCDKYVRREDYPKKQQFMYNIEGQIYLLISNLFVKQMLKQNLKRIFSKGWINLSYGECFNVCI